MKTEPAPEPDFDEDSLDERARRRGWASLEQTTRLARIAEKRVAQARAEFLSAAITSQDPRVRDTYARLTERENFLSILKGERE